jgi:hypothetical protein
VTYTQQERQRVVTGPSPRTRARSRGSPPAARRRRRRASTDPDDGRVRRAAADGTRLSRRVRRATLPIAARLRPADGDHVHRRDPPRMRAPTPGPPARCPTGEARPPRRRAARGPTTASRRSPVDEEARVSCAIGSRLRWTNTGRAGQERCSLTKGAVSGSSLDGPLTSELDERRVSAAAPASRLLSPRSSSATSASCECPIGCRPPRASAG